MSFAPRAPDLLLPKKMKFQIFSILLLFSQTSFGYDYIPGIEVKFSDKAMSESTKAALEWAFEDPQHPAWKDLITILPKNFENIQSVILDRNVLINVTDLNILELRRPVVELRVESIAPSQQSPVSQDGPKLRQKQPKPKIYLKIKQAGFRANFDLRIVDDKTRKPTQKEDSSTDAPLTTEQVKTWNQYFANSLSSSAQYVAGGVSKSTQHALSVGLGQLLPFSDSFTIACDDLTYETVILPKIATALNPNTRKLERRLVLEVEHSNITFNTALQIQPHMSRYRVNTLLILHILVFLKSVMPEYFRNNVQSLVDDAIKTQLPNLSEQQCHTVVDTFLNIMDNFFADSYQLQGMDLKSNFLFSDSRLSAGSSQHRAGEQRNYFGASTDLKFFFPILPLNDDDLFDGPMISHFNIGNNASKFVDLRKVSGTDPTFSGHISTVMDTIVDAGRTITGLKADSGSTETAPVEDLSFWQRIKHYWKQFWASIFGPGFQPPQTNQ